MSEDQGDTDGAGELLSPLRMIRKYCLDCSNNQPNEVRLCPCTKCHLYGYRLGHNPNKQGKKTLTQEEREKLRQRLSESRKPSVDRAILP